MNVFVDLEDGRQVSNLEQILGRAHDLKLHSTHVILVAIMMVIVIYGERIVAALNRRR